MQTVYTPDLFDVSIQMTFSLESDAKAQSSHAEALSSLLEMRNNLVHSRLATFHWDSAESCDNLVVELGGVNAAIAEQLEYIGSLIAAIVGLHKEGADLLVANLTTGAVLEPNSESDA
jgi:hypothetical protein